MNTDLEIFMPNRAIEWKATYTDIRARLSSVGCLSNDNVTHWLTIEKLDKKNMQWVVLERVYVNLREK